MKIAIFGGSFDPPHRGHLAIARAAVDRIELDALWITPVGSQPLKLGSVMTSYPDRLAMAELAALGEQRISASGIDAPREDGHANYTIDLLRRVRSQLTPADDLFFLLGADAFLSVRQWQRAPELFFSCQFIVAGRPGSAVADLQAALPESVQAQWLRGDGRLVEWALRDDQTGRSSSLFVMPDLHEDVSATDIRAAISGEQSAAGVLAPAVLRYIEERGLYR